VSNGDQSPRRRRKSRGATPVSRRKKRAASACCNWTCPGWRRSADCRPAHCGSHGIRATIAPASQPV